MKKIAADRNYRMFKRAWDPDDLGAQVEDDLGISPPDTSPESEGGKEWTVEHWINGNEYINRVYLTARNLEQIDEHKVRADHVLIDFGYSEIESVSQGRNEGY
jgi:hypothetical protein